MGPPFLLASGYGMILTLKVRPISRADETGNEATTSGVYTTAGTSRDRGGHAHPVTISRGQLINPDQDLPWPIQPHPGTASHEGICPSSYQRAERHVRVPRTSGVKTAVSTKRCLPAPAGRPPLFGLTHRFPFGRLNLSHINTALTNAHRSIFFIVAGGHRPTV